MTTPMGIPLAPGSVSLRMYPHDLDDAAAIVDELRAQAALAVQHGFDGVMTCEHHAGFAGYVPNPLQLAGFLLDAMSRGWAAPCPLLLPLRPPALVAEEIAWLAARHPGRVGVGAAAGALPVDFEVMGLTMDGLTARFARGLTELSNAIVGRASGPLAADPAIARCLEHPVPIVSAAASVSAARRAAENGCGLLFDSLVTAARVRELVEAFRAAGGTGPVVLIRRCWLGEPPRAEVERQVDVYRSYAPRAAPDHWGRDEMAHTSDPDELIERLAAVAHTAVADALNLRVHAHGIGPDAVREQIELLGSRVVPGLHTALVAPAAAAEAADGRAVVAMTVGVAVVGTGFGCLTHARTLPRRRFRRARAGGRDPEKTAARARRFEIPHACTALADALALDGVDAVTIATPPHTHAAIAREAIAAGRHVLCEKPFTRDTSEARALLAAADAAGVVHLLGAEMRFTPGQALLARVVRSGAIGEPRVGVFLMHIPMLAEAAAEVPEWWSDAASGGGWLGAHAPHVIDQIRTTVGEIDAVSATLTHVVERAWTAEDGYVVAFRTAAGAAGVMQAVAADRGPMLFETRVVGTTGTARAQGDRVDVFDAAGAREIAMPDDLRVAAPEPPPADLLVTAYDRLHSFGIDFGPYLRLSEHFLARIEGTPAPAGPEPATFADGVADMAVLDAIHTSDAAGGAFTTVRA